MSPESRLMYYNRVSIEVYYSNRTVNYGVVHAYIMEKSLAMPLTGVVTWFKSLK